MNEEKKKSPTNKKNSKTSTKTTPKKSTVKKTTKTTSAKKTSTKAKTEAKKTTSSKKEVKTMPKAEKVKSTKKVLESSEIKDEKVISRELNASEAQEYLRNDLEHTIIIDGSITKNIQEVAQNLTAKNTYKENKIIKRSSSKKYLTIFLYLLIIVIILACTIYTIKNITKEESSSIDIYEQVKNNTKDKSFDKIEVSDTTYDHIKEINLATFEKKVLDHEKFTLIVFSSTCYACAKFEPTIEEVVSKEDKTIYKLDIINLNNDEIKTFREYYAYKKTPSIITIYNGKITSELVGLKEQSELEEWVSKNM